MMKAALYRTKGRAADVLRVEERPVPDPAPGEVLVRVRWSGVNPSDVKSRAGLSSPAMDWPEVVPHSDGAGEIVAVGAGVPGARVGRAVWLWNGQWQRAHGTAAEYVALPSAQAVDLPGGVDERIGAAVGIPLMTAWHAVASLGSLIGRTVLVPGAAGAVGAYVTQLAARGGARVIAVVSNDTKAALARRLGAHDTIDYKREGLVERVRTLTADEGADAIVDLDAASHAPHYAALLRFGGQAVIYGSNAATFTLPFRPSIVGLLHLYCFIVYRLPPPCLSETIAGCNAWMATLQHPALAVYPLDEIAAAHERVERGADAKVLVAL
jgi:NADPH:quinone reductase